MRVRGLLRLRRAERGGGYLRVCVDGPVLDASQLEHVDAHASAGMSAMAALDRRHHEVTRPQSAAAYVIRKRSSRPLRACPAHSWTLCCHMGMRWRRVLRHDARAPGDQRLGHVRRDRRPARVRRGTGTGVPVRGVRVQDDHAAPARGQPAAAPVGGAGGAGQLDRPAQPRPGRLSGRGSARARATTAGAADHERDGLNRGRDRTSSCRRATSARRSPRSS